MSPYSERAIATLARELKDEAVRQRERVITRRIGAWHVALLINDDDGQRLEMWIDHEATTTLDDWKALSPIARAMGAPREYDELPKSPRDPVVWTWGGP